MDLRSRVTAQSRAEDSRSEAAVMRVAAAVEIKDEFSMYGKGQAGYRRGQLVTMRGEGPSGDVVTGGRWLQYRRA